MSTIKIFVTHTPNKKDYIIENPLMVNVIAGGDYQTQDVPSNMVLDNSGDNISKKNKSYCELTTQYWAWKNVKADYYGFCHYRRFLTLSSDKDTVRKKESERGQIVSSILNEYTAEKYNLLNEDGMRQYIEKYDAILPQKQNLSFLATPVGNKKTVYDHFAGHDRLFMNAPDLKLLADILEKYYPEYVVDAKEYLSQPLFWGFNCFILKRDLFFELCEFEFGVLDKLEPLIDPTLYNRQMSRIYGFMGEILSCIFFYHVQKSKPELKWAESKLVYFEYTDKVDALVPDSQADTSVLLNIDKIPPFLLFPTLEMLSKNDGHKKEIIIAHHNVSTNFLKKYSEYEKKHSNVIIKFLNYELVEKTLMELQLSVIDVRLLLPWILKHYRKILYLNWNTWITTDIGDLAKCDIRNVCVAGALDVLQIGRAFDVNPYYEKFLKKHSKIKKQHELINTNILWMNLDEMRQVYTYKDVFSVKDNKDEKEYLNYSEKINELYENHKMILPQSQIYYYTEDVEEKRIISQVPLSIFNAYSNVEKNVIIYNTDIMWSTEGSAFGVEYWNLVRGLDYYNLFMEHFINRNRSVIITKRHGVLVGGLKCVKDHGLPYTIIYALKKIVHMFK